MILPTVLDDAISFPQQLDLLKSAKEDQILASELADRFGVDFDEFKLCSNEALTKHEKGNGNAYSYD